MKCFKLGAGVILGVTLSIAPPGPARAALPQGSLTLEAQTLAAGLNSPLSVTNAGDDRLFIVEQTGKIKIYQNGAVLPVPFLDLASRMVTLSPSYDERGALGLAFHPDYQTNGKLYVYYSAPTSTPGYNHKSVISEFHVSADPNMADPLSERVLLTFDEPQMNHNAGDMSFGPDGYLYIASGDGGGSGDEDFGHTNVTGNGQDKTKLLGKLLRIDVDHTDPGLQYAIPPGNPFPGPSDGRDEIYCLGLRNPWRFSFDSETGALLLPDVGQSLYEEVNIGRAGGNYGWKAKEGFHPYDSSLLSLLLGQGEVFTDPTAEYTHSDGISITGGYVYRGRANPALRGMYVFGDLSNRFYYLDPTAAAPVQIYQFKYGPALQALRPLYIKSFGEGANGEIYASVASNTRPDNMNGRVIRFVPQVIGIGAARRLGPGTSVSFTGKTVTRCASDRYYIEESDRSSGIAVKLSRAYPPGTLVNVSGVVSLEGGELVIALASDSSSGTGQEIGQMGASNQDAAANLAQGLLLKVSGRVVAAGQAGMIRIDDGSKLTDGAGNAGLRISFSAGVPLPEVGSFVTVIGPRGSMSGSAGEVPVIYLTRSSDIGVEP